MPPSHFVDLRLVKTNLDKEGLKFQLEEHAVARILEVWGLLGSHYHCESRHCLYNSMRWIKKSVFNLKCTSVLHVFKLSPDYEELWKKRIKSLPLLFVACRKCVKFASQLSWPKFFKYEDCCQKEILSSAIPENNSLFDLQTLSQEKIIWVQEI